MKCKQTLSLQNKYITLNKFLIRKKSSMKSPEKIIIEVREITYKTKICMKMITTTK